MFIIFIIKNEGLKDYEIATTWKSKYIHVTNVLVQNILGLTSAEGYMVDTSKYMIFSDFPKYI